MNMNTVLCIKQYIREKYSGGLIGISDLAEYCKELEGNIYVNLLQLKKEGEINIVKRYFCPETHRIQNDLVPYCSDCDYEYSEAYVTTLIYIQPIKINQKVS